jgi:hypothetical protein
VVSTITEQELIDAIVAATNRVESEHGVTVVELVSITGMGTEKVRDLLKTLKVQGKIRAIRVYRENLAGIMTIVPAYQFVGSCE